jgi:flavin-dependent dehydrogenase
MNLTPTPSRPLSIIGGGLAGLSLGIELRRKGIPVSIWEAGRYPRHRVCGEFISGGGVELLKRLSLLDSCLEAGACWAKSVAFFDEEYGSWETSLPQPALCLSRFRLDALLARHFEELGGDLKQGQRWTGGKDGEGVIRASGRRPGRPDSSWHWFGVKAHVRKVNLKADLEMYFGKDGYVGLCRLGEGLVNVCGLFRRRPGNAGDRLGAWDVLSDSLSSNLRCRLEGAERIENSLCTVGGLDLRPRNAVGKGRRECRIGDAITMIPPVTGNGMSMALESASLAKDPLVDYQSGNGSWETACRQISRRCDREFRRRLRWANLIQLALFQPTLRRLIWSLTSRSGRLWTRMFTSTRC